MKSSFKQRNALNQKAFTTIVILLLFGLSGVLTAKNMLWKVETKKGNVYLLGSIHLMKKDHYPLDEAIEKAFEKADVLVLEVNPDSMNVPAVRMRMMGQAMFSDGRTLKSSLSDSMYLLLEQKLAGMGLPIENLNSFKPWFVAVTMSMLKLQALGFNPQYGVDQYFFSKAGDKDVQALETVDSQLSLFTDMSDSIQQELLLQTIQEIEVIETEVDQLLNAWLNGDTKQLEKLLLESFQAYPELYQKIMIDRNTAWMTKIKQYIDDDKTYLVVCGSGHLVGKDGLIRMLKQAGYKPEQL